MFGEDMYKYFIIFFINGDKSEEFLDDFIKILIIDFKNNIEKYCRWIIIFKKYLL